MMMSVFWLIQEYVPFVWSLRITGFSESFKLSHKQPNGFVYKVWYIPRC